MAAAAASVALIVVVLLTWTLALIVVGVVLGMLQYRFLQGRSDFVHRPAAPLASLYFQNDFFAAVVADVVAVAVAEITVVISITTTKHICAALWLLESPPPELHHKGHPLGATQDLPLPTVVGGADVVDPQKGPQPLPNLGDLGIPNDQRVGQSGVDFRELGDVFVFDAPPKRQLQSHGRLHLQCPWWLILFLFLLRRIYFLFLINIIIISVSVYLIVWDKIAAEIIVAVSDVEANGNFTILDGVPSFVVGNGIHRDTDAVRCILFMTTIDYIRSQVFLVLFVRKR